VIDVPHHDGAALELCYDPDWLAITKATAYMFPTMRRTTMDTSTTIRSEVRSCDPLHDIMTTTRNTLEDIKAMRTKFGGSFKVMIPFWLSI